MFLAVGTGMFTSVADAGSTIVALPTIASYFSADLPTTQWIVVAYLLTISALLVPIGLLSDMLGRKRIFVSGVFIFSAGAFFAAISVSVTTLILSRIVMGIGAAMSQGPSMAIMISSFPQEERGKALGLQMSAVGSGAVAGPALGGLIISAFGWRGIFFATSILGLVSAAAITFILQPDRKEKAATGSPWNEQRAKDRLVFSIRHRLIYRRGSTAGVFYMVGTPRVDADARSWATVPAISA